MHFTKSAFRKLACLLILISGSHIWGHQLYLRPDTVKAEAGQPVKIWVHDGDFDRSTYAIPSKQIVSLEINGPAGQRALDQSSWEQTKAGSKAWRAWQNLIGRLGGHYIRYSSSFEVVPESQGSFAIGLRIHPGRIAMEREAYLHYLHKEAFSSFELEDLPGMEHKAILRDQYLKAAKTIIQSGDELTDNVLQPLGLMAEIVPLVHPGRIKVGDVADFRVLLDGAPLPGQNVLAGPKAGMLKHSEESGSVYTTNRMGVLSIPITESGTWWLKFIHLEPVDIKEHSEEVDFISKWGSLTFVVN